MDKLAYLTSFLPFYFSVSVSSILDLHPIETVEQDSGKILVIIIIIF
jgi:hypothetical protein